MAWQEESRDPLSASSLEVGARPQPGLSHDRRVVLLTLLSGAPAVLASMFLVWGGPYSVKAQCTLTLVVVSGWIGLAMAVREIVITPLQTLSNLLAALREGDYSIRARGGRPDEPLGQVMIEANALGEMLHDQRLEALEATNLLRTVMAEIDVAVFTFDDELRLKLVNRAGERLMMKPQKELLGLQASELGLSDCLSGQPERTLQKSFLGKSGRWGMKRGSFRDEGRPHQVVVLTDLSHALREEERLAWRRLIRVMGHELNNSLTPIKSMAGTLTHLLKHRSGLRDWEDDMKRGLDVIGERSESLSRFMGAYARLARLPEPRFRQVEIDGLVRRVVALQTGCPIEVEPGPRLSVEADPDQLEQLLINLIRNAVEAAHETGGGVRVRWTLEDEALSIEIEDDGPGFADSGNLFVPFFTTKAHGSGIGLALSRQIAEAHHGTLELFNRGDRRGCLAVLRVPSHQLGRTARY